MSGSLALFQSIAGPKSRAQKFKFKHGINPQISSEHKPKVYSNKPW